jgi:hypothetical protein
MAGMAHPSPAESEAHARQYLPEPASLDADFATEIHDRVDLEDGATMLSVCLPRLP